MPVFAKNRTPAALAAQRQRKPRKYSQAELRQRRCTGLIHTYGGDWSLSAEVAAICEPLAERVAAAPNPTGYWRAVDDLTLAVHGLVHAVVGLLAERDARRKTAHLGVDQRGRSIRALVDLAERPKLPEIVDETMVSGTWAATLTALADPYAAEIAALLGNALTTAVSERLLAALREVDRAALALARCLDRDEQARAAKTAKATPAPTDQARAELESLGVQL